MMFADDSERHPGKSGFDVLDSGREFFTELALLADVAEHSIDAQYYIFKNDTAGRLLAARLVAAADRGVRVRLLLDDFPVGKMDEPLAAVNTHANVEVRVYNPLVAGWRSGIPKMLSFFFEFGRITRRMHNKSYVVDGTVAVVGGRNVGDEYIGKGDHFNFRDRDLIAIGPIVGDVSASFDAYWNSEWPFRSSPSLAGCLLRNGYARSARAWKLLPHPRMPSCHTTSRTTTWSGGRTWMPCPPGSCGPTRRWCMTCPTTRRPRPLQRSRARWRPAFANWL